MVRSDHRRPNPVLNHRLDLALIHLLPADGRKPEKKPDGENKNASVLKMQRKLPKPLRRRKMMPRLRREQKQRRIDGSKHEQGRKTRASAKPGNVSSKSVQRERQQRPGQDHDLHQTSTSGRRRGRRRIRISLHTTTRRRQAHMDQAGARCPERAMRVASLRVRIPRGRHRHRRVIGRRTRLRIRTRSSSRLCISLQTDSLGR